MTRNCDQCGEAYTRSPSLIGKFCSYACKAASMEKGGDRVRRRVRYKPGHPLAPPGGYVSEARLVLYDKIGEGPHPCHWCGSTVTWRVGRPGFYEDSLTADHLNTDELDDSPENLVPACGECNGTRGHFISDGEPHRVRPTGTRLRGEERPCQTCEKTFVAWDAMGRFCSRSCARRAPRKSQLLKP